MDAGLILLGALVVGGMALGFRSDRALPLQALTASARMFHGVWIDLLLGFLLAGLIEVVIPPVVIARVLGAESGGRAIVAGWVLGLAIPGGPYVLFPVAARLLASGAAPGPLLTLLTAKTLVSPIRMLTYEAPLLGWPLTLARFIPGVLVPPLLGILGAWLFRVLQRAPG